jgi:dihydrofolate synthase/folylpolyglutamate synthase
LSDSLDWLFGLEQFGIKFGLANITTILEALGHPERAFQSVHVAGTNGKGSVTAMVARALAAEGHAAARYTSPHLVDLAERFVVDGRPATPDALDQALADVRAVVERLLASGALDVHPTFFEVTTAVAFELFRRARVKVAVCEVGLGGRLDATNVLTPAVTAITSIGFDHERYLGRTISEIAIEKAGIVKPGVPVIVGRVGDAAHDAISQVAEERRAPLVEAWAGVSADEVPFEPRDTSLTVDRRATLVRLRTPRHDYGTVAIALRGAHQVDNAVVAVRVLETLDDLGLAVGAPAIVDGLARVEWPGRLDIRRLADGRAALLDAAHNPDGAAALAAFLGASSFKGSPLVFAVMRDKDADGILRALVPHVGALVATAASNVRSANAADIAARARELAPHLPVRIARSPRDAVEAAWRISPRIIVAGSIFLLGDVLSDTTWSW